MAVRIRIFRSSELVCETEATPGDTLHACVSAAGVFMDAPCGGQGKCGKCLVRLSLDGEQVLACRTPVNGGMDVYLPDEDKMLISGAGAGAGGPTDSGTIQPREKLGVAADIGTTTIVAHLTDIETGKRISTASGVNAQRLFGADVISRINHCAENGHEMLTRLIREQISSLILETCSASGRSERDIGYVSIAGNTIMEHLVAGFSPVGMGTVPFTPVSLFGDEIPIWAELPAAETARIYLAPAISAYVGGDITAGMLAAGLEDTDGPAVFLDIGTNGEIAMKRGDRYYCCATAAGPAFEGAEITMGMAAVSGAITHVKWDGGLKLTVLGDCEPSGLSGSGLIDALAVLLDTGAVDETGRLLGAAEIDHEIAEMIDSVDGKNLFRFTSGEKGVYMTAMDIRKLQLAKSAIAAGINTLLQTLGVAEEEVKTLYLAGGFGSFMDKRSAARIGLFPRNFLHVARTMGNTAGEGAALALCSRDARAALSDIRERCEYIELSTSRIFNEQFVEQMMFLGGI